MSDELKGRDAGRTGLDRLKQTDQGGASVVLQQSLRYRGVSVSAWTERQRRKRGRDRER